MNSTATGRFWDSYHQLPVDIQKLARKNYQLWRDNHHHPSLHFKKLAGGKNRFSVRVGSRYRAIGHQVEDGVEWVWIGTHEEYNKLVSRQ